MKFVANTVSKPVAGKEAKKVNNALKRKGGVVTNKAAMNTLERIARRRAEQR